MERDFKGTFGDFLQMRRGEVGLTIKEVAHRLKISSAYYSYFESGDRKAPDRLMLDKMAYILELNPEEHLLLYDLAGKTRGNVAADLPDYINGNPYVRVALRKARDSEVSMEKWIAFIKQCEAPQEAGT